MAYLNLLFTGVAVVVAAVVDVIKSPARTASAALSTPAAVVFPRSAPDDGKKPEGKGNTSAFNFGKAEEQRGRSTRIPRKCRRSRPAGVATPAMVAAGLLVEVLSASARAFSEGVLASAAPVAKRKPKGGEISTVIV